MIEKSTGYKVGQQFFTTLADAQGEAIANLVMGGTADTPICKNNRDFAALVMANAEKIVAILNPPKELRQRKPRADKGTKRASRKPANSTIPAAVGEKAGDR